MLQHFELYGVNSLFNYSFYYIRLFFKKPFKYFEDYFRVRNISKPDKNLGKFSEYLSDKNVEVLTQRFDSREKKLTNYNKYSLKEFKQYDSRKNLRLLLFLPEHVNNSKNFVENYLTLNVRKSAEDAGHLVKQFWGNAVVNSLYADEQERLSNFEDTIIKFTPDLLVIDSNFSIKHKTFTIENFLKLKKKYQFKVLLISPDFDIHRLKYWGEKLADFVLSSRPSLMNQVEFIPKSKKIILPGVPYFEKIFSNINLKEYDLYYSGSNIRQRKIFIDAAIKSGLNVKENFGNLLSNKSPTYMEFLSNISKARMTFGNGYVKRNNILIAGRFIESLLSKTVTLYETGPDVNEFFIPFEHYVPVSNIHDFVKSAQYLKLNSTLLDKISFSAYNYYSENYSSRLFWNYITYKLS